MIGFSVMRIFDEAKQEFLSKFFADLAKAVFAVGLASNFFVQMPKWIRISLGIGFFMCFLAAYFLQPPKNGGKK